MNSAIQFRIADESDAATVLHYIRELAVYEKLSNDVTATEASLRETLFSARPVATAIVIEVDGKHVGFAVLCDLYSTFKAARVLYLEDLYVSDSQRGKGIGKAFLAWLKDYAVSLNCVRIQWTVLDWNESAIGFYKGLGADVMPDWRVCRWDLTAST